VKPLSSVTTQAKTRVHRSSSHPEDVVLLTTWEEEAIQVRLSRGEAQALYRELGEELAA
jgi:hypothetical protein